MEGYRRVANCSPELPWAIKAGHLSKFSNMMMISGYNKLFRYRIIDGVIKRYRQMEQMVKNGDKVWFRSQLEIARQKAE